MTIPSQTKPLHVEKIVFNDGSSITGADAFLFNGFLVVDDGRHEAPTWHNVDTVDRLEDVTYVEARQRVSLSNW
ncbi:MAG: hypothetical protein K5771_01675 [Oscillospiraceae bacterium]|nr:hypothetical protein [Oscillospiraceae bacterium]